MRPFESFDTRCWESGLRIDIPEFYGSIQPEEAQLCGEGKNKIETWEKHMCMTFLPSNYSRLVYQQAQNLRQGNRTVTEYTTEFYQLIARSDIVETEEHMVSRYIVGLRIPFQDTLNLFDHFSVVKAHQRALQIEKQMSRKENTGGSWAASSSNNQGGVSNSAPSRLQAPQVHNTRTNSNTTPGKAQTVGPERGGSRCFNCGEYGHRMAVCTKGGKTSKRLFTEGENQAPVYDEYVQDDAAMEEFVIGDEVSLLVVQRTCFTPRETKEDDGWLRHNIFQSTCTIGGKVCRLVIDFGSCENVIFEEARALIPFSIGTNYKDKVWCDVVPMDACHILLGRPWEFDRCVMHNGWKNTYSFMMSFLRSCLRVCHHCITFNAPKVDYTWRLCTYSRAINKITLDLKSGYYQIRIREGDEWNTACKTCEGLYAWLIMPFGLSNALSTFMRVVEKINPIAYRLKLPSHLRIADVFNIKHLMPYHSASSVEEDCLNSRVNSSQPWENDANTLG
ncbi:hypothetical protein D8674_025381 [Pyrus ussuriensis x Pyrus communis]|uniref:CCHC-type domain-containing protein n=1 Tax=Pyrus ussuriensis x Pyrus communis TaxID=2448454 RepID=A0A5N5H5H0_9ROSA|nr:hypothetical protein D8674_025381 [Pyrus ussuriensis x Pyrus communis]